jgi:hypothetical protein
MTRPTRSFDCVECGVDTFALGEYYMVERPSGGEPERETDSFASVVSSVGSAGH